MTRCQLPCAQGLPRNVPPERIAERGSVGLVMTTSKPLAEPQLSPEVKMVLSDFLEAARNSFGDQLRSVTLFGSAAEGKLRPTSDVNLVVVLSAFEKTRADQLRQPLRISQAAIQLRPMFVLDSEIPDATHSFAPKFADILRRRVVLYGDDSFSAVSVPRDAEIRQLKQQLLSITLRLRAAYVARSLCEEQLAAFSEIVCWAAVTVLGLFAILWLLTRGLGAIVALVFLFAQSPLPWWILTPVAIALVAGFLYLFRGMRGRVIKPNRKYVNR